MPTTDLAARLLIDARNEAETVIRATKKALRSPELAEIAKTELVQGELERIESVLADLEAVVSSADSEAISKCTFLLNEATHHLAEVLLNRSVGAALTGKTLDQSVKAARQKGRKAARPKGGRADRRKARKGGATGNAGGGQDEQVQKGHPP